MIIPIGMIDIAPVEIGLTVIFLLVLILPFRVKRVEHNLEIFLFIMGAAAATIASKWDLKLVLTAVEEPIVKGIVPAVLIAGLVFFYGRRPFERLMRRFLRAVPLKLAVLIIVAVLGLISSVITAIIAAIFLVEIVNLMPLHRREKVHLVIIACFAIGLGAVLTPIGEPLSTIAVVKLAGAPYHAGFWYLMKHLGVLIVAGVLGVAIFGMFYIGKRASGVHVTDVHLVEGGVTEVFVRAGKVYAFVAALFLLGAGMEVIIYRYFSHVPAAVLFWVNMLSAVLDNATLTAAEIAPALTQEQINAALYGLLISGGMLIPGNIPNIISAGKLRITSSEWAKLGVVMGLVLNVIYFIIIFVLKFHPVLPI
jgi:predicted cation transporter